MTDPSPTLVLAGDVGGTKTNLATFAVNGAGLMPDRQERYPSESFPGLNAIIREFLTSEKRRISGAAFGIPGPIRAGRAKPTNLTWGVDAAEIATEFSIPFVGLLNDLAANAHGIAELAPEDFAVIQVGAAHPVGNRCVVSPGTGLGEAGLFWDGQRHQVWACEGGHGDFAPRNTLEIALLEYLIKHYGHVSCERVASGMGIENIYKFLRETGRGRENPRVAEEMKTGDIGAIVSKHAAAGDCAMCAQAIEIFIGCLGAEAGNMALKSMALGGVFLGGGIPVKLLANLQGVAFTHPFNDKGRLSDLMQSIPVKVVLNDQAALLGAARHAVDGSRGG